MNRDPALPEPAAAPHRYARHFETGHLLGDLKGRSVRGGAVTLSSQAIKFVLQIGSTMVLARLLLPSDFGLIAMVTAIVGFVAMFKDAGLSMATVQRKDITHDQVSTLFWINVALSAAVMLVVAALAPAIAAFYSEPRLVWVTLALAGTMLFAGFTVQHQALLRRQMRFKALAVIEIVTMTVGIAVAIVMALVGFGYWSLVGMTAAAGLANALMVWVLCDWRPGQPKRDSGVGEMLRFGGNLTGFEFINYWARNADNVLIGYAWGSAYLGLYAKAYGLLLMPVKQVNAPISSVFVPVMSRLADDPIRYERAAKRILRLMATLFPPMVALLAIFSREVISIMLGHQWLEAVDVFRWLALVCVYQLVLGQCGNMFITQGRTDLLLKSGMLNALISVVSIVAGLPFGIEGVAIAYAASGVLLRMPILIFYLGKTEGIRSSRITRDVFPSIAIAIGTIVISAGIESITGEHPWPRIPLCAGLWAGAYLAAYAFSSHWRGLVHDSVSLMKGIVLNRSASIIENEK